MNRFVVDQLVRYAGPHPYIDGLICRTTTRLGQLLVRHEARAAGQSNYTLRRLVAAAVGHSATVAPSTNLKRTARYPRNGYAILLAESLAAEGYLSRKSAD